MARPGPFAGPAPVVTVGAGQGDTVVRDLADAVVLLLQPETGDDIQWEKAGLLEVADVIAFLASPRAGYITGTIVTIDGGIAAYGSIIKPRPARQ